jgi:hypothetical protein
MKGVLGKQEGKPGSVMVPSLVRTVDCRLSTVECGWCQMNEFSGKTRKKTRVSYGAVDCEDCPPPNVNCDKWTVFWDKQERKPGSVIVLSLVRIVDCRMRIVDCRLSNANCNK